MKPFNLKEATAGKPICTRNGGSARILCTDMKNDTYPIVAAVVTRYGHEIVEEYLKSGKLDDRYENEWDLMMVEDEEPKCPFKPFDKVLTRDDDEDFWSCDFFSHYDSSDEDEWYYFACSHGSKNHMCIPYNEETEHLIGTTDAAPEKYVIW